MKNQIGLNIYTLYYQFINNFEESLQLAAQSGYSGIELFGDFSKPTDRIGKSLANTNLSLYSFHVGKESFSDEQFEQTIQYNKALGNDTMVIPCFKFENNLTVKDWENFALFLQQTSNKVRKSGMKLGYHNHALEFIPINGIRPWDIVMSNTSKDVLMQLDIGNARSSQQITDKELVQILKSYPGRSELVHIKPWSKEKGFDCILGQDDINWPMVIDSFREYGNTKTFLVEMEVHNTTAQRLKPCYDYLANLTL